MLITVLITVFHLSGSSCYEAFSKIKVSANSYYQEDVYDANHPAACANQLMFQGSLGARYSGFFFDPVEKTCALTNHAAFEEDPEPGQDFREVYLANVPLYCESK